MKRGKNVQATKRIKINRMSKEQLQKFIVAVGSTSKAGKEAAKQLLIV